MGRGSFSGSTVMQARKHARVDQEVMVLKKLMQKHLLDGGIFQYNKRIDYLKYDNCYSNVGISTIHRYYKMAKALNGTNHKIYYSICNWGEEEPWNWAPDMANSWRTT